MCGRRTVRSTSEPSDGHRESRRRRIESEFARPARNSVSWRTPWFAKQPLSIKLCWPPPMVVEAQQRPFGDTARPSRKTLTPKAKCVSPDARHEWHEQLKVQNDAVGDAEPSVRADEGREVGDGEPAAAAEFMLPRSLSLTSQPPGNKRAPTFM